MSAWAKMAAVLLALLAWLLGVQAALADKRVALVLGNSNYLRAPKLANPENDARDLAEVLRGLSFEVIFRTDVDRRGLDIALEEFERRAQGADTAMFFFAGHGLQYRGRNYLLPIDADLEDEVSLRYNTLPIDKVRDALDSASGVKIMVLDACRNNPLTERLVTGSGGASRGVEVTRGLARLDRAEGMVVAYATQADRVAQDGTGRNSPFSAALIRRLQEPNLEIATLFRRVAQDVFEQTGGRQRPELSISLLQDFYLNLRDDDSRVWRRISGTASEQELQDFVAKFPSSPYARDAQSRLYVLQTLRVEREALNKRIAALEAEREAFERHERELAQAEQREKMRRETEKAKLDQLAAAKAERDRQEAQAREREQLAAEKREQEKAEAARLAAEAQAQAQRQDALREAARQKAARIVAEREQAARQQQVAQAGVDDQRKGEKRNPLQDAAPGPAPRLDAERVQVQQPAAQRREPDSVDFARLAAETRVREQSDAQRHSEQMEAARREAARIVAEREQAFRQQQAAREEDEQARRLEKRQALRDEVAAVAAQKRQVAALEAAAANKSPACSREGEWFAAIKAKKTEPVHRIAELTVLQATLTCEALRPAIADAIAILKQPPANTPEQLKTAQIELRRLGCYAGGPSGAMDDQTRKGLADYFRVKGAGQADLKVGDDLLRELKTQPVQVCASGLSAPVAENPAMRTRGATGRR